MSIESFRDYVNGFKFYYFKSIEDFEKGIDCEGKNVSKLIFKDTLEKITHYCPYMAYGTIK